MNQLAAFWDRVKQILEPACEFSSTTDDGYFLAGVNDWDGPRTYRL